MSNQSEKANPGSIFKYEYLKIVRSAVRDIIWLILNFMHEIRGSGFSFESRGEIGLGSIFRGN